MGHPQRKPPTVIGLAGHKGSGKTTIAQALARRFNATIVSFGAYVRSKTNGTLDPLQLANVGAQLLADKGPHAFLDDAITSAGWDQQSPLIIEGIRHTAILDAILQRFPQVHLFFITARDDVRDERLRTRDHLNNNSIRALRIHSTERELSDIQRRAHRTIETDDANAEDAANTVARELAS